MGLGGLVPSSLFSDYLQVMPPILSGGCVMFGVSSAISAHLGVKRYTLAAG